jgi:hypothetical protein
MDQNWSSRSRSDSHGSLPHTFKAQRRPDDYAPSRPLPQRRPLRAVNENAHLLRSPGPLESMLKTTTETGDIRIYSIGPHVRQPATYHHRPLPRPSVMDGSASLPRTRRAERDAFHDDRQRLPSYRDTTSEIISLYASDTQHTYSRSFSPSIDDSRRSYSLTTCSSQAIPSHKSCATFRTHSSTSGVHRPRSPFPYPSRLKRPGTRLSSPVFSENGTTDHGLKIGPEMSHNVRSSVLSASDLC